MSVSGECRRTHTYWIRRWRILVLVALLSAFTAACSASTPFTIQNGTAEDAMLLGCAQEPHLARTIPSHGTFTFSDNVGERTLSDDPGFACLLKTAHSELRCLRMPTDQSAKAVFSVSEALPTNSFATCVARSSPHL